MQKSNLWLITTLPLALIFIGVLVWTFTVQHQASELKLQSARKDSALAENVRALDIAHTQLKDQRLNYERSNTELRKQIDAFKNQMNIQEKKEQNIVTKYKKIYETINNNAGTPNYDLTRELLSRNRQLWENHNQGN